MWFSLNHLILKVKQITYYKKKVNRHLITHLVVNTKHANNNITRSNPKEWATTKSRQLAPLAIQVFIGILLFII